MQTAFVIGDERFLGDLVTLCEHRSETGILGSRCRLTEGHGREVGGSTQLTSGVVPFRLVIDFRVGVASNQRNGCERQDKEFFFHNSIN